MPTAALPGVFGAIAPLVDHHGYLAIGVVVVIANVGVPVPAEAAVVTGAAFAAHGHLDLRLITVVAATTAAVGGALGYLLGRRAGHSLLLRGGQRVGVTAARLARAEAFVIRRGVVLVLVGRFLPVLRRWFALTAGSARIPCRRFLLANTVGAAGWAVAWAMAGNQAGVHLATLSAVLSGTGRYVAAALLLAVAAALVARRVLRAGRLGRTSA